MSYKDRINALRVNNFNGVDHMLSNNAAIHKSASIAEEADAEIAVLKSIIAEKDEIIADMGKSLEDAQRFIG